MRKRIIFFRGWKIELKPYLWYLIENVNGESRAIFPYAIRFDFNSSESDPCKKRNVTLFSGLSNSYSLVYYSSSSDYGNIKKIITIEGAFEEYGMVPEFIDEDMFFHLTEDIQKRILDVYEKMNSQLKEYIKSLPIEELQKIVYENNKYSPIRNENYYFDSIFKNHPEII